MQESLFIKLKNLLMKDTGGENESYKLIGVIRILVLTLTINNIINSIIYIRLLKNLTVGIFIAAVIAYALLLYSSYKLNSKTIIILLNALTVIWISVSVMCFGWGTGIQNYITILLALCFFTGYGNHESKASYAIFLLFLRLFLYFYSTHNTLIISDLSANSILQITNSVIAFFMISITMYIFSNDSQALEAKLMEFNKKLISQANTDALTGLYNRRKGREYMEELLDTPSDKGFAVCICDIDFFKKVNDNYGHDIGDAVLKALADCFKTEISDNTFIARWGGEEFLIVFANTNGDEACAHLQNIQKKVREIRIPANGTELSITMTFGLAEYDYNGDIDFILKEADSKLYIGKENGRDRIVF